jgi:ribosomal protein S12 methylthiotransferase
VSSVDTKNKYKVGILSLGCPRNLVDSESILGRLSQKGYPIVDLTQADVGIVNTCSFIEDAKRESIDAILDLIDLKKEGKLKRIIICGCLSQRYKDSLRKRLPEVDAFVGRVSLNHGASRFAITPVHYAYLKICEGCIHNCSYCVIPKIKGRFVSLDVNSVLDKVSRFDEDRISELNIIGQDITGYGLDLYGARKLPSLLKKIIKKAKHISWIRLLYLYPGQGIEELIPVIKDCPKICKYIDLPIQHINDRILKMMHRDTAKKDILKLIEKIRKNIPEAGIRTSLIVGFPSETEREFQELLNFVKDAKFERLGAFIYSREEDTAAYDFKKQIPRLTKIQRLDAIMSSQRVISQELNKRFLGKIIDVLIDEKEKDYYLGRSQYDAPEVDGSVYVNSKEPLKPGDFTKVKITDTLEYDLVGEAII